MRKDKSERSHQPQSLSLANLIGGAIILVVLIGIFFLSYKSIMNRNPVEYEGRVVDKWAGYSESQTGSLPYFRLLIETREGRRLTIAVDDEIYSAAKIGSWIRKSENGIEVSRMQPIGTNETFAISAGWLGVV